MSNYQRKLPYIPDKDVYSAVMFALKMMRQNRYSRYKKDIKFAADYYDVDPEEVEKYIRIAQGRGQKKANKRNPRKYKYYLIFYAEDCEYNDDGIRHSWDWSRDDWIKKLQAKIFKATCTKNAIKRLSAKEEIIYGNGGYYGYSHTFNHIIGVFEFDTKAKAQEALDLVNYETAGRIIDRHFKKTGE